MTAASATARPSLCEVSPGLTQVKPGDHWCEITAIPALPGMMAIEGAVVTIDAMGCQRAIARKIRDRKARYIIALKGSQGALHEDVKLFAAEQNARGFRDTKITRYEMTDAGHGRIETRKYTVIHDAGWLRGCHEWPGLASIIMVESTRETPGRTGREMRLYISSL